MKNIQVFISIFFLIFSIQLTGQEICDNALDDDNDGLIDLNDDDCMCETIIPTSLIPNPSFENRSCCPNDNAMLDCADGWIQASTPTTDYVHTCGGYLGNNSIPAFAPLPFPDGEGAVGFRDGQAQAGVNYKEYVGACLTEPMEPGLSYTFDFYVGFQDNVPGSSQFVIAVFASTSCSDLPFGGNSISIGCPSNTGDFTLLGQKVVSGSNEWVNVFFEFEADQEYQTIVLGPHCGGNPSFTLNPYFYVDRLTLAKSNDFGIPFSSVTGSICENDLILETAFEPENTYQWYLDGIALSGETNSSILLEALNDPEGTYMVVITEVEGCFRSQEYKLRIPPYYAPDTVSICSNELYEFGQTILNQEGDYERTTIASDGCDSIIQLFLNVDQVSSYSFIDTFCAGEEYTYLGISVDEPGIYQTVIPNSAGCDSTITFDLYVIEHGDGIPLTEEINIELGEFININPENIDDRYNTFLWVNESEEVIGNVLQLTEYQPFVSGVVSLYANDIYGCTLIENITINVKENYDFFIPNVFSPNEDGINDIFRFYSSLSVAQISSFSIFDRWGNLVFHEKDMISDEDYIGWNGKFNGTPAESGVYTYFLDVLFIDGVRKKLRGSVTLMK